MMTLDETISITESGILNFLEDKGEDTTTIYDYLVSTRSYLLELKNAKNVSSEEKDKAND